MPKRRLRRLPLLAAPRRRWKACWMMRPYQPCFDGSTEADKCTSREPSTDGLVRFRCIDRVMTLLIFIILREVNTRSSSSLMMNGDSHRINLRLRISKVVSTISSMLRTSRLTPETENSRRRKLRPTMVISEMKKKRTRSKARGQIQWETRLTKTGRSSHTPCPISMITPRNHRLSLLTCATLSSTNLPSFKILRPCLSRSM
mmetsp:Transcript_52130/g.79145  ORF Transcript_52130/g.79145 Transcript_52130/m.79145 type:complete len:202 (-) Transcript_52130:157-762(-)